MKKAFLIIVVIVILIFCSDKIYQFYSSNYVNDHESIILINDGFSGKDVDAFFNLDAGTFDPQKHRIIYSLVKKDAYLLDMYINLPTKYKNGYGQPFQCGVDYQEVQPYGFYDYEIGNANIIARIILKDANPIKRLKPEEIISEKQLGARFQFGAITILDVDQNGVRDHCK